MSKKLILFLMLAIFGSTSLLKADEVTIGDPSGATTSSNFPVHSLYGYSFTQQIYTAEEIGRAGTINSLTMWLKNTSSNPRNVRIYMKNVSKAAFGSETDWVPMSAEDIVATGTIVNGVSNPEAVTFNLTAPFEYDDAMNLVICFADETGSWGSGAESVIFAGEALRALSTYRDDAAFDVTDPTTGPASYTASDTYRSVVMLDITPVPFSVTSTDFGPRPNNAWMEPATVEVLGTGYEVTAMNIENDYFTFDGPAVPFTTPKTFEVTTGNADAGEVTGQMTLIYEGLRAGQVVELKATAYDPIEGDVFETAPMQEANFTSLYLEPDYFNLYHNYNLPGEASEGKDVVYKLKFTHDVILRATISTFGTSKAALYPEDFGGEEGPMADNAYKYTGTIGGNDLTGESGLYVTAGIYYLVAQAANYFTLNLNTTEATPLQADVINPLDGEVNVSITDTYANWILGDYTEEMQVLLGTEETLTDDDAIISWTSQLIDRKKLSLVEGETYYLQVNERNAAGETKGETVTFTTIINAPDNLLANDETEAEIFEGDVLNLTWDYTTTNDDLFRGFNLYKTDGINSEQVNEVLITENEYEVGDLEYNMPNGYWFYVRTVFSGNVESTNISNYARVLVSGNGTAKGHVYDQDGAAPLEGATLTFTGKDAFGNDVEYDDVTTNGEGFYTKDIKVGTYKVKASLADFEDATADDDVTITYGNETVTNLTMFEKQYKPTKVTAEVLEDGAVKVEWTMDRSLQGFNVYMRQTVGDGIATDEPKIDILAENITATTWYDNDWKENPAGVYQYGVEALYSGNHNPSRAAEELTVYDGTTTSYNWPFFVYYADDFTKANMIMPAADLAEMEGGTINSMKFYIASGAGACASNWEVYLKEVCENETAAPIDVTTATKVYEGTIDFTGTEVLIEFSTPYEYNGGNLLIATQNTTDANWKQVYFYGDNNAYGYVCSGRASNETSLNLVTSWGSTSVLLPKTTFSYEAASPITWSDALEKDMDMKPFTFKVSTNDDGQSVEGAHVTMTNVSEPEAEIAYEFDMDATGEHPIQNPNFRRGVYNIEVEPADDDHDAFTEENVNLWNLSEYSVELKETKLMVENIYVSHTGYAMWDEPKAAAPDRGFNGYNLYVDHLLVGACDKTKTYYQIDCSGLGLIDGQTHTFSVGVAQNNEPDSSYIKDYDFTYSECGNYNPSLSDPKYYSPKPEVECKNVVVTWGVEGDEFKEGFEGGLNGWTNIDNDGDGHVWYHSSEAATHGASAVTSHTGAGHVMGESYCNATWAALTPDDYMVTPQKYNIGSSSVFSFWACTSDVNYPAEHFGVAVSTGGNTSAAEFTTIAEWTLTAKGSRTFREAEAKAKVRGENTRGDAGVWYQYQVNLSAYAGQQVWIAIRHFNCTDQFIINVDDVELSTGSNGEIARGGSSSFTEGFENGLNGWTTIDADGDGRVWMAMSDYCHGTAHTGSNAAVSASYDLYGTAGYIAFNANNYLVSPQKYTIAEGSKLSFWYDDAEVSYSVPDYFEVCVSTAGNTSASDFTAVWNNDPAKSNGAKDGRGTRSYGTWRQVEVDLSAYAGQEVYIAFHHQQYDGYDLWIDDVELSAGSNGGNSTLTYNFDDGSLQGWTARDADGDGYNWYVATGFGANSGSYAAVSESYRTALTPDNYLVSPQLTLGTGASISFYEASYYGYDESLHLMVSTTGTNPSDFTSIQNWIFSNSHEFGFAQQTVDLSAYAGQQVYLAFRHYGSTDQYKILIDDITIDLGGSAPYPGNPELTRNSWALYLDGELKECVSKNIRHYEMTIEDSDQHTFTVVSIDEEYNMSCGEWTTFTAGKTTEPDSLAATVENNGIKLSWVGNSSEYKVYKGWAKDDLYEIETVETAEEYFDPQLKACWYGVSGVSECGESEKATVSSSITDTLNWIPQITWFTEEMTVTGVVSINNEEQFNSDLEIGAFIDDVCCGSARGLNLNGRSYFKFTVNGDDATQVVTFKVYDHSEDIELGYVSKTTLNFAAGTIVGSVPDPFIFKFISTDEHCMELGEGYNWVSTFIELSGEEGLDIIKEGLGENAQQIGSNLAYVQYYPASGKWYGSLKTAESEEMYVIKMSETADVCFTGMVADPEEHSITLVEGWNWIGFISGQEMNLATALGTITPSNGDLIKSHVESAQYFDGSWLGSLKKMEPGQGYKYQQNGAVQQTLTYPVATRVESVADNATAAESHWTADASRFAMNMSVMAAVSVDGSLVENGDIEVGAFCNGEVRGSARPVYVEALDRHVIFLTVFGNEGDNITFRLFNAEDGSEYTAAEHLVYSDDAVKGGIEDPFMLNFGGDDNISVFPNPTKGNVIVSADGMKNISVVNTLGQTVYRQAANAGEMTIDMSQFGAGMYLISIETENGTTVKHITVTR